MKPLEYLRSLTDDDVEVLARDVMKKKLPKNSPVHSVIKALYRRKDGKVQALSTCVEDLKIHLITTLLERLAAEYAAKHAKNIHNIPSARRGCRCC
jgi:hypothetical protein